MKDIVQMLEYIYNSWQMKEVFLTISISSRLGNYLLNTKSNLWFFSISTIKNVKELCWINWIESQSEFTLFIMLLLSLNYHKVISLLFIWRGMLVKPNLWNEIGWCDSQACQINHWYKTQNLFKDSRISWWWQMTFNS